MKSSFKIIAAAVALLAAGSSFAAVGITPISGSATGTELFFVAYDTTAGINTSFIMDLGVSAAALAANPSIFFNGESFSVNKANSQFSTYESTTLANAATVGYRYNGNALANTVWGVIGAQVSSATNKLVDFTIASGTAPFAPTSGALASLNSKLGYLIGSAGLSSTTNAAQLLAGFASSGANYYTAGNVLGDGSLQAGTFLSNVGAANTANFASYNYALSTTPNVLGGAYTPTKFSFDGVNLVVAAVPEPTSYAMMLAGLLMIGVVVARRRNSK